MAAGPTCAARGGMIQAGSWTLCDTFTHLPSCAQNSPPVDFPLTVRLQRTLPLLQQDDPAPHTRALTCHIDSRAECDTAFAFTFGDRGSSHSSFLPFPFTWSDSKQGLCIVMIDDRTVFLCLRTDCRQDLMTSHHSIHAQGLMFARGARWSGCAVPVKRLVDALGSCFRGVWTEADPIMRGNKPYSFSMNQAFEYPGILIMKFFEFG